ncbi:MAG: hypothetical protein P8J55_05265 [Pseudomonadales bacterium]|nr:hypothetical protein [Pseudomonadales bacterium]
MQMEEIQINDHSTLAMQAAKRMRRIKYKRKNSRVICHHLLMMLNSEDGKRGSQQSSHVVSRLDPNMLNADAARQFSLGIAL